MALLPISPGFKSLRFRTIDPTLSSIAQSGAGHFRKLEGQRWAFTAVWPRLTVDNFAPISAFVDALRGSYTAFEVIVPGESTPRGTPTGTPLVNGAGQSGSVLVTDGWTPDTVIFMARDKFKLASHTKVYQISSDVTSDALGNATLPIYPPLIATPADNEALVVTDVPFTVRRTNDVQEYNVEPPDLYRYEIDVVEVI